MCKLKPFKVVFYDFDKERTDANEVEFNSLDELENHQVLVEATHITLPYFQVEYEYPVRDSSGL